MRVLVTMLVAIVATASPARADGSHAITLVGPPNGCPSSEAFSSALRTIYPDVRILEPQAQPDESALHVELTDTASSYRVVVGPLERELTDADMRCDERARKAAVFVALALSPPSVELPAVTPVPEKRRPALEIAAGAIIDAAPRTESASLISGGAQARGFVGTETFGLIVGVAALSPTTSMLPGVTARLTRVPLDVGVRRVLRGDRVGISFDAGLVTALLFTKGIGSPLGVESTRVELGLRVAATVDYQTSSGLAPFFALQAQLIPDPYNLEVPSSGVVGTTPRFWLGGVFGMAIKVR